MSTSRRDVLKAVAAAPLFVPQSAFGANDRINYAIIATGGRGRYLMGKFKALGAECTAMCDVYEPNLDAAAKITPQAKRYLDYEELLAAHKDLDAVALAGPDHHHWPMLKAALKAKKDAYAEKPLSHTLEQSAEMVAAV